MVILQAFGQRAYIVTKKAIEHRPAAVQAVGDAAFTIEQRFKRRSYCINAFMTKTGAPVAILWLLFKGCIGNEKLFHPLNVIYIKGSSVFK